MPKFEVHIPAGQDGGFNVTFRVDADNWMAALKTGMTKLGEQGSAVQNVLVDIQDDDSIHVTESRSGRVFRIRELSEEEAASAQVKMAQGAAAAAAPTPVEVPAVQMPPEVQPPPEVQSAPKVQPAPGVHSAPEVHAAPEAQAAPEVHAPAEVQAPPREEPPPPADVRPPSRPITDLSKTIPFHDPALVAQTRPSAPDPSAKKRREPLSAAPPAPQAVPARQPSQPPPPRPAPARVTSSIRNKALEPRHVVELERPTRPVQGTIGRPPVKVDEKERIEDLLAEVFDRVQDIYAQKTEEAAMYFILDLALEKIPAESGSVYRADAGMGDLNFCAVRGPKAAELLEEKLVVPAGTGIVGFCATEGVSVAVSDVQKDPRYYKAISEKLAYNTQSVLCAPMMTHGRTFGCVQLLNKKGSPVFGEHEVGLLAYLSHQAALFLNVRI